MLHIIFSSSGAGSLRQALYRQGLRQHVVDLTDHLDWGPITVDSFFEERQAWLNRNIPVHGMDWDWIADGAKNFAEKVATKPDRLIWIAPQSASELCGLYWYLDLFDGDGASMVVVDDPLRNTWRNHRPVALGELAQDRFLELLLDAERNPWDATRFPASRWQELCADASLLRIAESGQIKSVSEDFFDSQLLALCSSEWRKLNRIIGETMVNLSDNGHYVDDLFLWWRLRVLSEQGRIESNREIIRYTSSKSDPLLVRLA